MNKTIWIGAIIASFFVVTATVVSLAEASEFLVASDLRPLAIVVSFEANTVLFGPDRQMIEDGELMVVVVKSSDTVTDVKSALVESLNNQGFSPGGNNLVSEEDVSQVVIIGALTTLGSNLNSQ
ncbi:MAG: hypothetical protein PVG23_07675 [Nitrosopumilaceae archaeon]